MRSRISSESRPNRCPITTEVVVAFLYPDTKHAQNFHDSFKPSIVAIAAYPTVALMMRRLLEMYLQVQCYLSHVHNFFCVDMQHRLLINLPFTNTLQKFIIYWDRIKSKTNSTPTMDPEYKPGLTLPIAIRNLPHAFGILLVTCEDKF